MKKLFTLFVSSLILFSASAQSEFSNIVLANHTTAKSSVLKSTHVLQSDEAKPFDLDVDIPKLIFHTDDLSALSGEANGQVDEEFTGDLASRIVLMGGFNIYNSKFTNSNSGGSTDNAYANLFVNIAAMYMLTQTIGVGLAILGNNYTAHSNDVKTSSEGQWGAGVFGRYYFPCFAPRFYTFGQVGFNFQGGTSKEFDSNTGDEIEALRDNVSSVSLGINPGFSYFLTPAIALEMSFGLFSWGQTTYTNDQDNTLKQTNSDVDFWLNSKALTFGFCWWLGPVGGS